MDIHDDLAATLSTMDAFAAILATETDALSTMRLDEIPEIQSRKAELASLYRRQVRDLQGRRSEIEELAESEPELRERIEEAWTALAEALTANVKALEDAREATEHVVELLVDATRKAHRVSNGYGLSTPVTPTTGKDTLSVTIDRKL